MLVTGPFQKVGISGVVAMSGVGMSKWWVCPRGSYSLKDMGPGRVGMLRGGYSHHPYSPTPGQRN